MAKAAAHLAMSQPAVSEAVASLEATLQVRLLDRGPRGIEPTIYGQALLKRGTVVFDELRQGIRDIEYLADPATGEIRIGCPESLAAGFVPVMIDQFSRRHPQVTFQVVDANIAALEFRELRERTVDLMLGRISKPFADDEINIHTLFDDRLFVVASTESRWARRRKIALAELVDEPWILAPPNNLVRVLFVEAFHAHGLQAPRAKVTSNSINVRMHLLASGRFLTFLAESLLRHNAKRWSLKALQVDLGIQQLPVAVATLRNRTLSPTVQLFIEHIKAATVGLCLAVFSR
jgi:DNA-binding transcriptional LysR family regulator